MPVDEKYRRCLEKGKRSFEELWNGRYFVAWKRGDTTKDTCMSSQLLGQFWCDMLDLPPIVDEQKIRTALTSIYELGYRASKYCIPNPITPDGKPDEETPQLRSCWTKINFAVAAHMILRDLEKEGLAVAEREWRTISDFNPWNINSRVDPVTGDGLFLQYYISSPTV